MIAYNYQAVADRYNASRPNDEIWYTDDSIGGRLARCADCFGMYVQDVVQRQEMLQAFGLAAPPTSAEIGHAKVLVHKWDAHIRSRQGSTPQTEALAPAPSKPREKRTGKVPADKDAFGSRKGSRSYEMNATIITGGASTAAEMARLSGIHQTRCKAHVKWLADRGFITGTAEAFALADGSKTTQPETARAPSKPPREKKSRARYTIWDINACSILRWMGADGWEFDDACLAVETLGCVGMREATMRLHWSAGRRGYTKWGQPAELTSTQKRALREAAK